MRVIVLDGDPWFVIHDVCAILPDFRNPTQALMNVEREDRIRIDRGSVVTHGHQYPLPSDKQDGVWFVAEEGVRELIFRCGARPSTEPFRRWLVRELVPTVRKVHLPWTAVTDLPHRRTHITVDPARRERLRKLRASKRAKAVHALYRFFDADGQLLYVGQTWRFPSRMGGHRATQSWWHDVAQVTFKWFPDRATVDVAELDAIRSERPLYNIKGAVS